MRRRVVITLFAVAVLSAAVPSAAQTSGEQAPRTSESEVRGLDRLTPEERAQAEKNLERWRQLSPEQRKHLREQARQRRPHEGPGARPGEPRPEGEQPGGEGHGPGAGPRGPRVPR